MSTQQWVTCPHCRTGYYFMWEYDWDNMTKCIQCHEVWECVLELEEDEETQPEDEETKEADKSIEKSRRDEIIRENHLWCGLFTEELLRDFLTKDEKESMHEPNED